MAKVASSTLRCLNENGAKKVEQRPSKGGHLLNGASDLFQVDPVGAPAQLHEASMGRRSPTENGWKSYRALPTNHPHLDGSQFSSGC
jgi:hypothetical protein